MAGPFVDSPFKEYFHPEDGRFVPPDFVDQAVATDQGDQFNLELGSESAYEGDIVDGGLGSDIATLPLRMDDYEIVIHADNSITLTSKLYGTSYQLISIEYVLFAGGSSISLANGPVAITPPAGVTLLRHDPEDTDVMFFVGDDGDAPSLIVEGAGAQRAFHILGSPGDNHFEVSGDFTDAMSGQWSSNGLIQFYWGGQLGINSITFAPGTIIPFKPLTHDVQRSYAVSMEIWGGTDTIDAQALNVPAYVMTAPFGSTSLGADRCDLSIEGTADWVDLSFTGGGTFAANLATNTLTRNGTPVFTSFSGVDHLRFANGNVDATGHGGGSFFLLGAGTSSVNGGGHRPGEIDAAGINGYNVFGAVTFDFTTMTATGPGFNLTMVDMNGAFGGNSDDFFYLDGPQALVIFGMAGDDDVTIVHPNGHMIGYEAPRNKLQIDDLPNGTWQVYDLRGFNEVPSGKLRDGLDTIRGDVAGLWIRASDAVFLLDETSTGQLDVAISSVATGLLPGLIVGGTGSEDRVNLHVQDLSPWAQDMMRIFDEAERLRIDQQLHGKVTTTYLESVEHVFVYGDIDYLVSGNLIQAGVGPNTLTLVGGSSARTMDASGVTSNSHIVLQGLGGNDTLAGGAGNDDLQGGSGNGDVASFVTATSAIIHTLAASGAGSVTAAGMGTDSYSGMEGLSGGSGNDRLTGNGATNFLGGHSGNDSLAGLAGDDTLDGGVGSDSMTGGEGDDCYYVDNRRDQAIEIVPDETGGADTVYSGVAFTLGDNIEDLVLTGTAKNGNGNTLANHITGNEANNRLRGYNGNDTLWGGDGGDELQGGAGDDSMEGGAGSDKYYVDSVGDIVNETIAGSAAGGLDTVYSEIDYTLGVNVENLRLLSSTGLDGTGNSLNNRMFGSNGADLILGLGGHDTLVGDSGADTLVGGAGNDTLTGGANGDIFRFASSNAGNDRIEDFVRNGDRFQLSGGTFTQMQIAGADTILTHNGGTIRIVGINTLNLNQWNALAVPGGEGAAAFALTDASSASGDALPLALRAQHDTVHTPDGDWLFA